MRLCLTSILLATATVICSPSFEDIFPQAELNRQDQVQGTETTQSSIANQDRLIEEVKACDHHNAPDRYMIYCDGKLLHAVMVKILFPDSKTFVDMPMKENYTGNQIMEEFNQRFNTNIDDISTPELREFVQNHFDHEGDELRACSLPDWKDAPKKIIAIEDDKLRDFGLQLHAIWKQLCREVKPEVKQEPHRFSLLNLPNPFIIPGGRFRENYYWDSYWIVRGLLVSGLTETARGIIQNMAYLIDQYGFVPNGARVYYLQRSQPPLFACMLYDYYQATRDEELLRQLLPMVEKEMVFWLENRSFNASTESGYHTVFQYRTNHNTPRPESYREDIYTAEVLPTEAEKHQFYQNLASAAESGWDFSSRWLRNKSSLITIETTDIVPVDLNAFICHNMHILSVLHGIAGNVNKQSRWIQVHLNFRDTFKSVFYVKEKRGWYDYNIRTKTHNLDFYPSMAVPLFAQCYDFLDVGVAEDIVEQMEEMGSLSFQGGVPSSLHRESHQQWDYPNGWSPSNHMIIEGLRKSGHARLQQKAFELAEKWINTNLKAFERDHAMWEKYNIESDDGRSGHGGEYVVQAGFGWTNGVILDLLSTYSDRLTYNPYASKKYRSRSFRPVRYYDDSSSSYSPLYLSIFTFTTWYLMQ